MNPLNITIALWALNLDQPLARRDDWLDQVDRRMADATRGGAELLVLPEYASAAWLSFAPAALAADLEVGWMAGEARNILPAVHELARHHELAVLAGSCPALEGGAYRNRAWLLLPDGRAISQDKLCLTPAECDPRSWLLEPGHLVQIVEWQGVRLAILVCLDVELPALAARLAYERVDLILVPSQTAGETGFARVTACARARAVELMCATCVAGCIGPAGSERFSNVGGAAAYVPCEPALGTSGIVLEEGPFQTTSGPGPLFFARLPLAEIRRLRAGAAEVWPGAWRADHVRIVSG